MAPLRRHRKLRYRIGREAAQKKIAVAEFADA